MRSLESAVLRRSLVAGYLASLVFLLAGAAVAAPPVEVEALFKGSAVLMIGGERKMLRAGQSHDGVTLIDSTPVAATLLVDGQEKTVGLSRQIGSNYEEPAVREVTIARDSAMRYQTNVIINGRSTLALVDTGANVVAMSAHAADALGIEYRGGEPTIVETASGVKDAYMINLRTVSVGGIEVGNVRATVVEGQYPATILLGMTYLEHVKLQEHNGVLSLSRPH